jgi:soluble lytic murein transglycosylase-like protein
MTDARFQRRRLRDALLLIAIACGVAPIPALGQGSATLTAPPSVASADAAIGQLNSGLQQTANRLLQSSARGPALAPKPAAERSHAPEPSPALSKAPAEKAPGESSMESPGVQSRALARVEQLRPMMEPILRQQGVPSALLAVVLVESGGQPAALSPKGARGAWQLMPETARRYGLVVSGEEDERLDPLMATRAAARYLHDLYAEFGDWPLALAAYNAGEQAVQRAIQRADSNSFSVLSELRLLPPETRMYVPSVLRASREFGQLTSGSTSAGAGGERRVAKGSVVFASLVPALP